jgi:phosphoribosylformylglycinamidine cyclo-ligase
MNENDSGKQPELRYRDAGVDIDAADEALKQVKEDVRRTFDDRVLQDIGSFGAMYRFPTGMDEPILVSSVDGVGTKLKLAFMTGIHDTVGIDLVAHCVNDILVQGARPLYFLDYLACGKLEPDTIASVIRGLANGCRYAGCSLIGGETAEMPGMYAGEEYDLAGTIVGVVDRANIVDGSTISEGDAIIGFPSSGLHTNGYSLARHICFDVAKLSVDDPMPGTGKTVAQALMEPHLSYSRLIQILTKIVKVKGMTHITGGGITDNLPRTLPKGMGAKVDAGVWEVPPVFSFLKKAGNVPDDDMLRTFNMGIGYLVIVDKADASAMVDAAEQTGQAAHLIGHVVKGETNVTYTGDLRYAASD